MKMTIALVSVAFIACAVPGLASAQTNPGPPPPLKTQTARKVKGIPPAPPISAVRGRRKASTSGAASQRIPGQETYGRIDMSAKPVGFYPASKSTGPATYGKQESALKVGTKRVATPAP